jgi:hypothetical protein
MSLAAIELGTTWHCPASNRLPQFSCSSHLKIICFIERHRGKAVGFILEFATDEIRRKSDHLTVEKRDNHSDAKLTGKRLKHTSNEM